MQSVVNTTVLGDEKIDKFYVYIGLSWFVLAEQIKYSVKILQIRILQTLLI